MIDFFSDVFAGKRKLRRTAVPSLNLTLASHESVNQIRENVTSDIFTDEKETGKLMLRFK